MSAETNGHSVQPQVRISKRADYREIYTNAVSVSHTISDVKFSLGLTQTGPGNEIEVELHTGLSVSPQQAKMILEALSGNLRAYEARFGIINIGQPMIQPAASIPHLARV